MGGLRDRFEHAGHERPTTVGLHHLDLEALARSERMGTERHADQTASAGAVIARVITTPLPAMAAVDRFTLTG